MGKLGHIPLPYLPTPVRNAFLTLHIQLIILLLITQAQSLSAWTSPSASTHYVIKPRQFLEPFL